MFLSLKKMTLAAVVLLGAQAFAKGDQTGLLSDLYSSKQDYDMYINKGITENTGLTNLIERTHSNLLTYEGRSIAVAVGWTAPIRQTLATFSQEFAIEDRSLHAVFNTVASIMNRLNSQQKGSCNAVNVRYQTARSEMARIWSARDADSKIQMNSLKLVADQLDAAAGGTFMVTSQWLNQMMAVRDASVAGRASYTEALKTVDANLLQIYDAIRVCYQLD